MIIILADTERDYLENIQFRLNSQLPAVRSIICQSSADALHQVTQSEDPDCLVIFNPADFPDLPVKIQSGSGRQAEFWPVVINPISADADLVRYSGVQINRFGKLSDLVKQIKLWQTGRVDLLSQPAAAVNDPPLAAQVKMHLLVSVRPNGYQPEISRKRLKEMIASGKRVVYLPLMPTYQMVCLSQPGHGLSLSDLLMHLLGKSMTVGQLGQYWQPGPEGCLQFRPPDRSDDLVVCSPDLLRSLLVLLQDRLRQDPEPGEVLVDCAGLPLSSVAAIAVLCASVAVLMPERDCYATTAARREISQMMANLPASCQVMENHAEKCPAMIADG